MNLQNESLGVSAEMVDDLLQRHVEAYFLALRDLGGEVTLSIPENMGNSVRAACRAEILNIMKNSGPASTGLTFIWMPQLFARMFLGKPLAMLFFLGLTLGYAYEKSRSLYRPIYIHVGFNTFSLLMFWLESV